MSVVPLTEEKSVPLLAVGFFALFMALFQEVFVALLATITALVILPLGFVLVNRQAQLCVHCGGVLDKTDTFCIHCGKSQ